MDVFGSFKTFEDGKETLRCRASDILSFGYQRFFSRAESLGVEKVIVEDFSRQDIEESFTETPSVFLESRPVETDIRIVPGDKR